MLWLFLCSIEERNSNEQPLCETSVSCYLMFVLNISCVPSYIILIRTMCSNDTLGNTPFQLISDFFHDNQGV